MFQRLRRLRSDVDIFKRKYNYENLVLTNEEWKQIEYLIDLTKPFMIFINIIKKTSGPVIQDTFEIYDVLFNHIETANDKLHPKRQR